MMVRPSIAKKPLSLYNIIETINIIRFHFVNNNFSKHVLWTPPIKD